VKRRRGRLAPIIVGMLVAGAWAGYGAAASPAATARLAVGTASRLPLGARSTGALPATQELPLSIALTPRDPSGLQAYATAVSSPGSPDFHRYLTVAQFASAYGATTSEIAAVRSALRAAGLTVGAPLANQLTLPASGTAAEVHQAFATKLVQVQLAGGRRAYANAVAPTVPAAIAGDVQGVIGLDTLVREHRQGAAPAASHRLAPRAALSRVVTGGPQPCSAAASAAQAQGGYTADTIASAYGFSSLYGARDLGAGQTVAVYELQPYDPADVATYQRCYGTSASVTNVAVDNPPAFVPGGDDTEAALDIEQVIGLAPAARILVYEAPNSGAGPIQAYATIVSQDQAKVVSSSWGSCEADALTGGPAMVRAENTLFEEAAVQGQTIYEASGDAGSADCSQSDPTNTALSVGDPASQPFATGVGGTALYTTSSSGPGLWSPGDPLDQAVWNDGNTPSNGTTPSGGASGSGGGISSYWAMPAYQSGAPRSVGVVNALSSGTPCQQAPYCREVPDVSADGDPVTGYVAYTTSPPSGSGWSVIAGTSAAAPLWAAFTALVDGSPTCGGRAVGFVNPELYRVAGYGYGANIGDVSLASPVSGAANNDALGTNGGRFPVTPGYDMATGLGTPIAPALARSLCTVYSVAVTDPGHQSGSVGAALRLPIHATDSGRAGLTYGALGLPAGLTINAGTGLISGTPKAVGTSTVTVVAGDQYHNAGATQFTWTIKAAARLPMLERYRLTGIGHGRARLTLTVLAGPGAPALRKVSVALPRGLRFASRTRGIAVAEGGKRVRSTTQLAHGVLTISFRSSLRRASITIGEPAISVSQSVRSAARHHRFGLLAVVVVITDARHRTTKVFITQSV